MSGQLAIADHKMVGPWIAVGGAALAALGSTMAWADLRGPFGLLASVSGVDIGDGKAVIGLAAAAVVLMVLRLGPARGAGGVALDIACIVMAGLIALVATLDRNDIHNKAVPFAGARGLLTVEVGLGLWLVHAAAVIIVVGAVMSALSGRRRPVAASPDGCELPSTAS